MVNHRYWLWEGALSKEFCNFVLTEVDWSTSISGVVLGEDDNQVVNPELRRTDIVWQKMTQPLGCIAKCYMEMANHYAGWGYALTGREDTQIGRYKSSDEGHYDWHMDAALPINGIQRKLSVSILLSDPSEFEGGELQFKGAEDEKIFTKQGSIVVFPSFIEHRVTPVTKGVRYSAVTWISGPSFR